MQSRRKRAEAAERHKRKVVAHHQRVLAQRPLVDTTAPRSMTFKHMKVNKKKEQAKRERQLHIWKRNQSINESLVDIETRKGGEYTARGAVSSKSLRIKVRLDEVDRINRENARLYQSILQSRATGNAGSHAKFGAAPAEGWKHHEESFEEFRRRLLELPQLKQPSPSAGAGASPHRRPASSQGHGAGGRRGSGGDYGSAGGDDVGRRGRSRGQPGGRGDQPATAGWGARDEKHPRESEGRSRGRGSPSGRLGGGGGGGGGRRRPLRPATAAAAVRRHAQRRPRRPAPPPDESSDDEPF